VLVSSADPPRTQPPHPTPNQSLGNNIQEYPVLPTQTPHPEAGPRARSPWVWRLAGKDRSQEGATLLQPALPGVASWGRPERNLHHGGDPVGTHVEGPATNESGPDASVFSLGDY